MLMELQNLPFNFFTFILFIFVLLTLVSGWKKSRQTKQNLPPGPWKLPLLGNLHNLLMGSVPHHTLRDLARKHGPLMLLKLGEVNAIVVSSPRMAKEVMKTHDIKFANRPVTLVSKIVCYDYSDIAFSPYGDYWRQMRKICVLELFSSKCVRSFLPLRQDESSRLIATLQASAGKPINLTEKISFYTTSMVCRAAFGKVNNAQNKFCQLVKDASVLAGGFDPADLFPSYKFLHVLGGSMSKLLKIHGEIDRILEEMLNEHKKNHEMSKKGNGECGEEDIIDILLRIRDGGDLQFPFTDKNIKGIIFDIFGAGTETSSSVVDWAMAELMRNPKLMAKAQNEVREAFKRKKTIDENDIQGLKYLKSVIKEALRLHPPVPMLIPRESREACQIDGYNIPSKTRVFINAWAISRDEDYWTDPESFMPERFENSSVDFTGTYYEFVPFGAGRRICPGMSFGLANVDLLLALLLYHFDWKLPPGLNPSDVDMSETIGIAATRKNSLVLIPVPYDIPCLDNSC